MKKTTNPHEAAEHHMLVVMFAHWYQEKKGIIFSWDGKQAAQLKILQRRINALIKSVYNRDPLPDEVNNTFSAILKNIASDNKLRWVFDNVSPATINSKFNEIISAKPLQNNYSNLINEILKK